MVEMFDGDNSRHNTQQFAVTSSWNRVSLTFAGYTTGAFDDDNALSLYLTFWLHAGSSFTSGTYTANTWASNTNANRAVGISSFFDSTNRTLEITGLQMEVGDSASDFEHRSFAEEFALCERYFFTTYNYGATIGAASTASYLGRFLDNQHSYGSLQVPTVAMRGSPTRVIYNPVNGTVGQVRSDSNNHSANITGTDVKGGGWIYANASVIGTSVSMKAHLTMDAEL